jgi:hypothetical protein
MRGFGSIGGAVGRSVGRSVVIVSSFFLSLEQVGKGGFSSDPALQLLYALACSLDPDPRASTETVADDFLLNPCRWKVPPALGFSLRQVFEQEYAY